MLAHGYQREEGETGGVDDKISHRAEPSRNEKLMDLIRGGVQDAKQKGHAVWIRVGARKTERPEKQHAEQSKFEAMNQFVPEPEWHFGHFIPPQRRHEKNYPSISESRRLIREKRSETVSSP